MLDVFALSRYGELKTSDEKPVDPLGAIDLSSGTGVRDAAAQLAMSRSRFAATLDGSGPGLVVERS